MAARIDDGALAGAHEHWRGVGLTELLRALDEAGLHIAENQRASLQERRRLADKTKAFRAVADERKADEVKGLLRAYQGEIDALTKRMRFAENEFLKLFKTLSAAPDPTPFLQGLAEERRQQRSAQGSAEAECERLRAKCAALDDENRRLREQSGTREGAEQRAQQLEAAMGDLVAQREREVREETAALVAHLRERESDLQQQLSAATRRLAQQDLAEAERVAPGADRDLVGRLAELEIVQSDLDHATARVADLQAQNAKLRSSLAQLTGDGADGTEGASVADTLADYRRQIRDLSEETRRLFDSLEKADAAAAHQRAQHDARTAAAESDLRAKDDELQRVRRELERRADYDEVRRELDVMKSVEFSAGGWGLDAGDDEAAAAPAADGDESLERLLVRRNKELENRLVDARTQLGEAGASAERHQARAQALEAALAQKTALAERLEADLLRVGAGGGNGDGDGDGAGGAAAAAGAAEAVEMQAMGADAGGVLQIVTGQRDRFRERNMELEDELRGQAAALGELQRQAAQAKQDNLRLYEEIKYLRSYTAGGSSQQQQPLPRDATSVSIAQSKFSRGVDMDAVDAKYKTAYEESLNPFSAFHRRESARRMRSMALFDRLVYMFSSFVAANRRARMAALAYAALLHLLVIGALYRAVLAADDAPGERVPA